MPQTSTDILEIKTIVRHRDGFQCTECGITNEKHIELFGMRLDVHRIIPGSEYSIDGCQTLCRPCHGKKPKSEPKVKKPHYMRIDVCLDNKLLAAAKERARRLGLKTAEYVQLLVSVDIK